MNNYQLRHDHFCKWTMFAIRIGFLSLTLNATCSIFDEIGKGVHSHVFKGRKRHDIEFFAIKRVVKSQKARVHKEAHVDNEMVDLIETIACRYETNKHLWLILEYCVGGDLNKILQQDMRLPEASVHDFGRDLLAAMQHLHSKGIIHCDLKPSNILLDENGGIKLGGFSVSRRLDDISNVPLYDIQPTARGTPAYMAPELFDKEGSTHSMASDFWSFGCILYQCFCGRPPFVNTSFSDLVRTILHEDPAPMTNASEEFTDLVRRLLDKNPGTRITWTELLTHPFWQFTLAPAQMPEEPTFQEYITSKQLKPATQALVVGPQAAVHASIHAQRVRESVDVNALSQMVHDNMKVTGNPQDPPADGAGISLQTADAEVQFREHEDNGMGDISDTVPMESNGKSEPPLSPTNQHQHAHTAHGNGRSVGVDVQTTQAVIPPAVLSGDSAAVVTSLLDELVFRTDTAVRPLVGNRRIETYSAPAWNAESLPNGVSPAIMEQLVRPNAVHSHSFVSFIENAHIFLSGNSPISAKCNFLAFLEPISCKDDFSSALINSRLGRDLMLLFNQSTSTMLRTRVVSLLGVLIRFAAHIDPPLLSPAVELLQKGLSDDDAALRRRTMVTMGELLFYTCNEDLDTSARELDTARRAWPNAASTAAGVLSVLKRAEDPVAQHYAAKALDNIMTRTGFWPMMLASEDAASALLTVLETSEDSALRSTAASALARVLRVRPAFVGPICQQQGVQVAWRCLTGRDARLQLNAMTLMSWILLKTPIIDVTWSHLPPVAHVVITLQGMLYADRKPLTRAKAFLLLASCCRSPWFLERALDSDVLEHAATCPAITSGIMLRFVARLYQQLQAQARSSHMRSLQKNSDPLSGIIAKLLSGDDYRKLAVNRALVDALVQHLKELPAYATLPEIASELTSLPQQLLDSLLVDPDSMMRVAAPFLERLSPTCCEVVQQLTSTGNHSENAAVVQGSVARMLAEILMFYIANISAPLSLAKDNVGQRLQYGARGQESASLESLLHKLLVHNVLPLLPALMEGQQTLPLYAQKILASLLTRSPEYVHLVNCDQLVPRLFDFLSLDSPNNNIHNIRVCRVVVIQEQVSTSYLSEVKVAEKVGSVLAYAATNQVNAFLEPSVELAAALLEREQQDVAAGQKTPMFARALVPCLGCFVSFAGVLNEPALAAASSSCAAMLGKSHPVDCSVELLTNDGIERLIETLAVAEQAGATATLLTYLNLLLQCGSKGKSSADEATIAKLHAAVSALQDHSDPDIAKTVDVIVQLFE